MKNTWPTEGFLQNRKIDFITKNQNLDFVDETINSTSK